MAAILRFLRRLLSLFRSRRAEAELTREIDAHLQLLEDQFVARGMSAGDARFAARRAFGGVEQAKEHQRDARTFRWLAGWPMDLKLGARMLVKSPGLTLVAVVALSIATGGGVFHLEVTTDHFHPTLPIPQGDRLVGIQNWDITTDRPERRALHDFAAWRESLRSVEHLGAAIPIERNLITEDGRSEPVRGVEISASAFRLAPTPPLFGRPLLPEDERPEAPPVVLIGYQIWQSRFAGDPGVVGQTVRLGSTAHTITGVMPNTFGFPSNQALWVPLKVNGAAFRRTEGPEIIVFGRLAEGVTLQSAQAELTAAATRVEPDASGSSQRLRPIINPYVASLSAGDMSEMWIVYSFNIFFLGLLALCGTNVATLVFARTATREGEITVRTALGASRGRIVGQLFAEALVLSVVATTVGLGLASYGIRTLHSYLEFQGLQRPFWWNDDLSAGAFVYAAGLAVLGAALIGIVPALKATGPQMQARLKHAAAGGSGLKFGRLWTGIVVGQIAVTVVCLMSVVSLVWNATAGQEARHAVRFPAAQFVTAGLELDRELTPDGSTAAGEAAYRSRFLATYHAIERRFESEGHIAGVTYASQMPGRNSDWSEFWVELDGMDPATRPSSGPLWVRSTGVAADLFETFDARILRGRRFTDSEIAAERNVAIVDETFARLILGGRDPIGLRVRNQISDEQPEPGPWLEIVGVVDDLSTKPDKTTEDAVLYRPLAPGGASPIQIAVRVKGDARGSMDQVRLLAADAGADVRLQNLQPLEDQYRADSMAHILLARALAIVAAVALLLAAAGVYSLMSFTLARRTREIGIRAALGAGPRRIIGAIFSRAFQQIALGVLVGSVPGAAIVAFGAPEVAHGGGLMLAIIANASVGGLIALIALFACVVPARRALRIHPTDALRADA